MMFLTSGWLSMLYGTFLLALLLFFSCRSGRWLLQLAGFSCFWDGLDEECLVATGLGLTVLSLGTLALGVCGGLSRIPALVWLAVFAIPVFLVKPVGERVVTGPPAWVWYLCVLVILLSWIQTLAPPTGQDALAYHLENAKQWVLRHRVAYLPDTRESLWPSQTEMLYALGLLIQGTPLAQLFHWAFYLLTSCGVFCLARRLGGVAVASAAAIIFLMTPAAFAQSGQAYIDLALAFFTLLAVYPLLMSGDGKSARLAALSGFFAGAACGTKYLGLGCALVLFVLWVLRSKFERKVILSFVVAVLAIGGIWYFRSWRTLGNPFYPFFSKWFGGNGFDFPVAENVGLGHGPLHFIFFLWNMTLHPVPFGGQLLGPLYLMLLPFLLLLLPKINPRGLFLGAFIFFYLLFLFVQSQQTRFFLSAAPLLAVTVALGLSEALQKNGFLKKTAWFCLVMIGTAHFGIYFMRVHKVWPVVIQKELAEVYLEREDRSFRIYRYLNEHQKPGETFFNAGDARFFYGPPGAEFDSVPLRRRLSRNGKDIFQFISERNFNYVLVAQDTETGLERYLASHSYRDVLSYEAEEKPAVYRYTLYYLPG